MLGRIIPGRLPSTVADIKLLDERIAFNKKQLSILPQKVAQGLISERDAAYRRLYLEGEIEQLTQTKRNRRFSTPSYRTPLDVFESNRRGAPAKKYTPESNNDNKPDGYFGDDNGSNGGSISSDWNENIEDFDVPDISVPPGPVQNLWPAHWPGNHSPAITQLVMKAGKVNGVQVVNPKLDPEYKLATDSLEVGIKILSEYESLRDHVKNTTGFTPSDGVLVSQIETKVRGYVESAKAAAALPPPNDPQPAPPEENVIEEKVAPTGPLITMTEEKPLHVRVYINNTPRFKISAEKIGPQYNKQLAITTYKVVNRNLVRINRRVHNVPFPPPPPPGHPLQPNHQGWPEFVNEHLIENGASLRLLLVNAANDALEQSGLTPSLQGRSASIQGFRANKRTGNLMGLGALQAHDRASFLVNEQGLTPTQRKSYLQAEREMALAKKRAGSKVNLTKQLREEPITRPWQMQVSLSTAALNAISTKLNQQLASMNLSQEMFTQQMHTNVAAVINSMPSGMAPSEQAEMIIEHVMAKVTNSSGLLKKDVKVDINRGSTSPLTFNQAESLSGVVGSLSGTRAALGRLLR